MGISKMVAFSQPYLCTHAVDSICSCNLTQFDLLYLWPISWGLWVGHCLLHKWSNSKQVILNFVLSEPI